MNNAHKPAFPCTDGESFYTEGSTKRERFALAAMQGLLSEIMITDNNRPDEIAHDAVKYADALLNQLEKEES